MPLSYLTAVIENFQPNRVQTCKLSFHVTERKAIGRSRLLIYGASILQTRDETHGASGFTVDKEGDIKPSWRCWIIVWEDIKNILNV